MPAKSALKGIGPMVFHVAAGDLVGGEHDREGLIEHHQPEQGTVTRRRAQDGQVDQRNHDELAAHDRGRGRVLERYVEERPHRVLEEQRDDRDEEIDAESDGQRDAQQEQRHGYFSVISGALASTVAPLAKWTFATVPARCARISFIIFMASMIATT
jgi:hypothetical protein